jgi:hypothetical protein
MPDPDLCKRLLHQALATSKGALNGEAGAGNMAVLPGGQSDKDQDSQKPGICPDTRKKSGAAWKSAGDLIAIRIAIFTVQIFC